MEQTALIKESKIESVRDSKMKKILYFVSFYLIAAVLLLSGIAKIIDPIPLLNTLKLITFIPESFLVIIATLLPVAEIGLALLMFTKTKLKITLPIIAVLLTVFLGFSIYGMLAGYSNDCGCFGNTIRSSFSLGMIIRNAMFLIISLYLTINAWPGRLNNKNIKEGLL